MLTYLKRLATDEGAFIGLVRSMLAVLGLGIESGKVPFPPGWEWTGLFAVGAAMLMRSSVSVVTKSDS